MSGFLKITTKIRINVGWKLEAEREALKVLPLIVQQITAGSKRRSPFQFGTNRRSIDWRSITRREFKVFTESGYGGWLHIGSRGRSSRPYMIATVLWLRTRLKTVRSIEELRRPLGDPGRPMMFGPAALAV